MPWGGHYSFSKIHGDSNSAKQGLYSAIVFLSGTQTRTMGSLSTQNQGRMSFKRRDPAQVQRFACIFIHGNEKTLNRQRPKTKKCFCYARWSNDMAVNTCTCNRLKRPRTGNKHTQNLPYNEFMIQVLADQTQVWICLISDIPCLLLFIAFLCGWGSVAFYGELIFTIVIPSSVFKYWPLSSFYAFHYFSQFS